MAITFTGLPDAIPTKDWLNELVKAANQDPEVGVAQSLLLNFDGTIDSSGGFVNFLGYPIELGKNMRLMLPNEVYEIGYAKGAAALFRRDAYFRAGGFDERFFFYYEETDLCHRIETVNLRLSMPLSISL